MLELFGLSIPLDAFASGSEGALDTTFRRGRPAFDADVAIVVRLRCARVACSDETSVRVAGRTCWNGVFPAETLVSAGNSEGVIHVVRGSRGAGVARKVLDGRRPALWVSDPCTAQQGHAEEWQICLAHWLRDCTYAIEAGDAVSAPRMKVLLLRAVVLARPSRNLAPSTRREFGQRSCASAPIGRTYGRKRSGQSTANRLARRELSTYG